MPTVAPPIGAAQHRPRPLPLFLAMLRSETAEEPARAGVALAGLRAYQDAPRVDDLPRPAAIARAGRASLIDYGGGGPLVLFVPSLINPPTVLDLDAERSLLRWLAGRGVRPLLLDWGTPRPGERDLTVAGHVETMLLPLIDALGEPVALAGYCLGGTMALAAAALRPVRGLVTIAAPWRFAAYPDGTRVGLSELWAHADPVGAATGLVPMDLLQAAFWRLDPARTIAKYEALGRSPPDAAALARFVRLEDWANDGPPLTHGAARELFQDMYLSDVPGRGAWRVGGRAIDPAALAMPVLEIASTTDRIVPAAAGAGLAAPRPAAGGGGGANARKGRGARAEAAVIPNSSRTRLDLPLGHVGMIVGGRARAALWEPLARWLCELPRS